MKQRACALGILTACLATAAVGWASAPGGDPGAPGPAAGPATRPADKVLRFDHLTVDLDRRRIVLDVEVCEPSRALEFLLVHAGGKEYESVLRTKAQASQLHAALLALGLTPGKPARWSGRGESARFLPPRGPALKITLRWKDKNGQTREADAAEWLAPVGSKKVAMPKEWIFIGSDVTPDGRYLADVEGVVITVANFASAVIDVPFESSDKEALMDFQANAKAMPPANTAVLMIIEPKAGAEKSPHARAMLEIDRFGRLRAAGQALTIRQVEKWATDFITKHPQGQVDIRADGRALVADVARAMDELRIGGVDDIVVTRLLPESPILPRTPEQADQDLQWWAWKFQNASDLLRDPGQEAQEALQQIQKGIAHLQATEVLWRKYAQRLQEAMDAYKKTRKPGQGDTAAPTTQPPPGRDN